jgi:peptidoglycan/LPS O-acetylase OafA/YrhL
MLLKERLNNNYDFLRILAALCITFTHSYNLLLRNADEPLMKLTKGNFDFSFLGLSIFFSISGYLIAKSANNSFSFKNFVWKRFLRIQPMLIVVCILSIFFIGSVFSSLNNTEYFKEKGTYTYFRNIMPLFGIQFTLPQVFAKNIAENGVNGSLWTLIVEERLYLLLGLLCIFKLHGKKLILSLILVLNILYFMHYVLFKENLIKYLSGGNVFYALIFLNSSAIYLLKIPFLKFNNSYLFFVTLIFILFLSPFLLPEKSMQIIFIPLLVIAIANLKGFTNKVGKYGDFTYGIYAFSFPIQQMVIASYLNRIHPIQLFFMTLLFVLPVAILSWHCLEKRMLLLKGYVK